MKITGFSAQGISDFDERRHRALIASNHPDPLDAVAIADGVDAVVAHLDSQDGEASWVNLVKESPYYITRRDA